MGSGRVSGQFLVSLPDGEKISKICLFVLTWSTNVTDGRTLHDSIDRACIASRGKNRNYYAMWPLDCRMVTGRYVLGILYGENRPKSEKWANLTPGSSATVHRREKLTNLGNFLALGLQRGVNSVSLQCIPWSVACSEHCYYKKLWVRCLFDRLFISDFGGKWPLK